MPRPSSSSASTSGGGGGGGAASHSSHQGRSELSTGTFFNSNNNLSASSSMPPPGSVASPNNSHHHLHHHSIISSASSPSSASTHTRPHKKARTGSELPVSVAEDVGTVLDFSSNEDDDLRRGIEDEDELDEGEDDEEEDDSSSIATTSTNTPAAISSSASKKKNPTKAPKTTSTKVKKGKGRTESGSAYSDETNAAATSLSLFAESTPATNSASPLESNPGGAAATNNNKKKTYRKNTGEKKKKAGRACAACQRAHLTCDDARPCARCIKKGKPEECHDGTRKKAKYLQEVPDELLERKNTNPFYPSGSQQPTDHEQMLSGADDGTPMSGIIGQSPEMMLGDTPRSLQQEQQQPTLSFEPMPFFDTSAFSNEFGSEAANLEYAILSSMLNGNGFALDASQNNGYNPALRASEAGGNQMMMVGPGGSPTSNTGAGLMGSNMGVGSSSSSFFNNSNNNTNGYRPGSTTTSPSFGSHMMSPPRLQDTARDLFPPTPGAAIRSEPPTNNNNNNNNNSNISIEAASSAGRDAYAQDFFADEGPPRREGPSSNSTSGGPPQAGPSTSSGGSRPNVTTMTGEQAYRAVTKPYPYAQSYHYLVKHLKDRFEKNDILRIIRALATFRPSLIALQMPLSEEDETFVERTFQRTLVELNKLISFSGTPTVVWRRTGEICLVGTEFCLLTGWQRDELVGNKFIFELMDTSSVVEYYESFAKHAFESTSSSVEMQCVVLGPNGRPVPCAMCFTIRRDLFSCPFLIVGSFLPILV